MLPDTFYQDGAERKKSAGGGTRTVLQSRPAGLGRCAAVPVGGAVKTIPRTNKVAQNGHLDSASHCTLSQAPSRKISFRGLLPAAAWLAAWADEPSPSRNPFGAASVSQRTRDGLNERFAPDGWGCADWRGDVYGYDLCGLLAAHPASEAKPGAVKGLKARRERCDGARAVRRSASVATGACGWPRGPFQLSQKTPVAARDVRRVFTDVCSLRLGRLAFAAVSCCVVCLPSCAVSLKLRWR